MIDLMQDGGVLLVAATRENVSPSLVLELLKRIGGIIKASLQQLAHSPLRCCCVTSGRPAATGSQSASAC